MRMCKFLMLISFALELKFNKTIRMFIGQFLNDNTLLALITPALIGVNFGLLALLGPAGKGPRF